MSINFHLLFKDVFLFKYIVIWYKIISPYLKKKSQQLLMLFNH